METFLSSVNVGKHSDCSTRRKNAGFLKRRERDFMPPGAGAVGQF
ncbi:MAG: hypothetical protein ACM34M_11800 [Ignavibacteria bacterium]